MVFAIDSILVAVAVSNKPWVVVTGGILGIVMMRLVIGRLLTIIRRYPTLVDGAFIIIVWVGVKLLLEYGHQLGYVPFEIPKWLSLGLIVVIMGIAYVYARRQGPVERRRAADWRSSCESAIFRAARMARTSSSGIGVALRSSLSHAILPAAIVSRYCFR